MSTNRWADLLRRQVAALAADDFATYVALEPDTEAAMIECSTDTLDPETIRICSDLSNEICRRLRQVRDVLGAEIRALDSSPPRPAPYETPVASALDLRF